MNGDVVNLTEDQLRTFLGPALFERAEAYLAAGKLVGRYAPDEGGVAALWDWSPRAVAAAVYTQGDQLYGSCDCGQGKSLGQGRTVCDHVATLLLAWTREPETFVEEAELGEPPMRFTGPGMPPPPAPPPALQGLALPMLHGTDTLSLAPPNVADEFRELLGELTATALRDLAGRHGLSLPGRSREALLEGLAEALSRPAVWRAACQQLSPLARIALAVVPFQYHGYGMVQVHTVKQMAMALLPASASQWEAALQELISAGLALADRYGGLRVPRSLPDSLPPAPGFLTPVKSGSENSLRAAPAPGPLDFPLFTTRLLLVLQAEGPRLRVLPAPAPHPLIKHLNTLQGWPVAPAELDALAKEPNPSGAAYRRAFTLLPAPSPLTDEAHAAVSRALGRNSERLDFALRLLDFLGLVELAPGQPVRVLDKHLLDFLQLSPAQRLVILTNAWLALNTWTEFDRLAARRPPVVLRRAGDGYQSTYQAMLNQLALTRLGVVRQVRQAPPGVWSDIGALAARARGLNCAGLLLQMGNDWYPDWNKRRPALGQARDWDAVYGPFVEAMLTGPLSWLGLVELGYARDELRAFRLSPLGAFIFRHTETYALPPAPQGSPALSFQSDGSLSLRAEEAGSEVLTLLSLLGSLESGARGELRYTISAEGASRAFEAGWEVDRISGALRQAAGAAPPRALAESLRRWRESFGTVQVYPRVALLELNDDFALAELLAGTSLAQHLLYRFSPRLVALRPDGLEALKAELEKKGYTPKVAEETQAHAK